MVSVMVVASSIENAVLRSIFLLRISSPSFEAVINTLQCLYECIVFFSALEGWKKVGEVKRLQCLSTCDVFDLLC